MDHQLNRYRSRQKPRLTHPNLYLKFLSLFLGGSEGRGLDFSLPCLLTLKNRGQAAGVVTYLYVCVLKINCYWLPRQQRLTPLASCFLYHINPSFEDL